MKEEIAPSWLCWQCGAGQAGRAVGCGESCCSSCTLPWPGRAVLCVTRCWDDQHHGRAVLPPRPAQGSGCPLSHRLLSLGTALFPRCSGGSRMLEWLYVFRVSWPGQELAVWFSLSLKHRCQDVPTGRTFALMPTWTKILFLMPFSMGYTCP